MSEGNVGEVPVLVRDEDGERGAAASAPDLVDLLSPSTDREDVVYELCNTIANIVSSYDDPYDAFAELVQNALDAVALRWEREGADYTPAVTVKVDLPNATLGVSDNGVGISWEHHRQTVRPNYSLKRRLGQASSRGEKGAALSFLQFAHSAFELETSDGAQPWRYTLREGKAWYLAAVAALESATASKTNATPTIAPADMTLLPVAIEDLPNLGSTVSVTFDDNRLISLFTDTASTAKARLEYFLRTRTGLGFHIAGGDPDLLEEWQKRLQVRVSVTGVDKAEEWNLELGFFYPHLQAKVSAQKTSLFSASTKNNELLYDYFDVSWLKRTFFSDGAKRSMTQAHLDALSRVKATGYFAYAHQNQWYEETAARLLSLPEDPDDGALGLSETLVQVNGGFAVAVRDFPTGRRKTFLHRSGAEHKSRSFVLINFSGDYQPDYGRKNLGAGVHGAVLALCKDLIAYANSKKSMLLIGTQQAVHGATSTADARQELRAKGEALKLQDPVLVSGSEKLGRPPITETEVIADFLRLVANNTFPGYTFYGLSATGIFDGFFDFEAQPDASLAYDPTSNSLGLSFKEGRARIYSDQWMEFKVKSDKLIDDFNKQPGETGKKFFSLLDLLVCEATDDATEGYELDRITPENYEERTYFGVTHLLRKSGDAEHVVQVISLSEIRRLLDGRVTAGAPAEAPQPSAD